MSRIGSMKTSRAGHFGRASTAKTSRVSSNRRTSNSPRNEQRVANLLRDFVEWGGRYPSPANFDSARSLEWNAEEIACADSLYDRLVKARRAK